VLGLLWPCGLLAQGLAGLGFAGLGSDATGFATPDPAYRLEFPADHGAHPDFRIEWWYLTANLRGDDGRDYGVQWTLFRSGLKPQEAIGWQSPQMWMGHAAVTTPDQHYVAERLARGGIGQAGVRSAPFEAWIDEWRMGGDDLNTLNLQARGVEFAYDLRLVATGPLVLHGADGYSVKSVSGRASHYYSQPSYRVEGVLHLPGGDVAVTGQGWLDREWSSQPLAADQTGWDWFSLSFAGDENEGGARMMGFVLRGADAPFVSGTWINSDGSSITLDADMLRLDPLEYAQVAGRKIPVVWRVRLAQMGLDVTVWALNEQAWMDTIIPYWEGPVRVSGSHSGRGYLEMTGYE
jgi:predicted secreted hydrolase